MKIFYILLFALFLTNSSALFIQAADNVNANSPQENSIAKVKGTLLFEDDLIQIYYTANSVKPTAMMKMKLTEGPMYYFGKLTFINKTDSELEIQANVLNASSKEETRAKVEKLAARRLGFNDEYLTDTFSLTGAVAKGASKKLKRQYDEILSNIDNYYTGGSMLAFQLPAKEKNSMEFGLSSYSQKLQIAVSYRTSSTEPLKFFFQGISDIEAQKQVFTESKH